MTKLAACLATTFVVVACQSTSPVPASVPDVAPTKVRPKTPAGSGAMVIEGECGDGPACFASADGARTVHPRLAVDLHAAQMLANGDLWIAGDRGVVLRIPAGSEPGTLRRVRVPVLRSQGALLHDGAQAHQRSDLGSPSDTYPATSARPADLGAMATSGEDLWLTTALSHDVMHFDGARWTLGKNAVTGPLGAVDTDGVGRAILWGEQGALFFGAEAQAASEGPRLEVPASGGVKTFPWDFAWGADELWVVGLPGLLAHSDGRRPFTLLSPRLDDGGFTRLWLNRRTGDGWVVAEKALYRKRGKKLIRRSDLSWKVHDVLGFAGSNEAWLVGDRVARFDGETLHELPMKAPHHASFGGAPFEGIAGRRPNDVWVVGGNGHISHWDGAALTRWGTAPVTEATIESVSWTERGWRALLLGGPLLEGGLDGGEVALVEAPHGDYMRAMLADGTLVVGDGCHLAATAPDGTKRALADPPECLYESMAGRNPEDFWSITEDNGGVHHHLKGRWTTRRLTGYVNTLAAAPNGDLWVAGDRLFVIRQGSSRPVSFDLDGVTVKGMAFDGPKAWFGGSLGGEGVVLQWDGAKLERVVQPPGLGIFEGLVADGQGGFWAVGSSGVALHHDGSRARYLDSGVSADLNVVARHPSGAVMAFGDGGVVVTLRPPGA